MCLSKFLYLRFMYILITVSLLCIESLQGQAIISPVQDVFFYTFGGGEGCNTFLKYDITSIPSSKIIDSVFVTSYVYLMSGGWNGNMDFWNVNDQDWTEADSCALLWSLPTSDSTHQTDGFGTAAGWTRSVDLASIFLTDASNTYCSIKMKDPDETTSVPMPGSFPYDYDDSLIVGDRAIGSIGYVVFYPHEWANAPPWLVVYYHSVGISEKQVSMNTPTMSTYPNPFKKNANIIINNLQTIGTELKIYNSTGCLIRSFNLNQYDHSLTMQPLRWNGRDASGDQVSPGVYFCKLKAGGNTIIKKICLIK
jgi:hypothetical protein